MGWFSGDEKEESAAAQTATVHSPGAEARAEATATPGQFEQLGNSLAAKHSASPNGTKRGGRKTAAEETADFLSRNGMRAVPVDTRGDSDGGASAEQSFADESGEAVQSERQYVVTPEFIASCADTLLHGIEAYRKRQVFLLVEKLDPSLSREMAEEAGAPPGAIDVMTKCCAELSQKYDWVAQCGPEGILCAAALVWIMKDIKLHKKLSHLAKLNSPPEPVAQPDSAPSMRNDE